MLVALLVATALSGTASAAQADRPRANGGGDLVLATGTTSEQDVEWQPCKSCEWTVRSVQDFVADPSHQKMMAEALDSIACMFVPKDHKGPCHRKVNVAVRHVVQLFEDYVSPKSICKPLCENSVSEEAALPLVPRGTRYPRCQHCKFAASELATRWKPAGADGPEVLSDSCSKLPEPFMADCMHFADMANGYPLMRNVKAGQEEESCIEFGHCEVPGLLEAVEAVTVPAGLQHEAAELASAIGQRGLKAMCMQEGPELDASQQCEFCRMAVMEIRDKISDPEFQSEVEVYLRKLCGKFGDYQDMCKQYVDQYLPIVFALAEDYLDPRNVCAMVHMCPKPHPRPYPPP